MKPSLLNLPEREFPALNEVTVLTLLGEGYDAQLQDMAADNCRIVRTVNIDGLEPGNMSPPETRLIWIGIASRPSADWERWIEAQVGRQSMKAYVIDTIGHEAIDWAWARFGTGRCTILADAGPVERRIALRSTVTGLAPTACDSRSEDQLSELDRLREEVGRIAYALACLTQGEADRLAGKGALGGTIGQGERPPQWPLADDGNGVADDKRDYDHQPALDPYGRAAIGQGVTSLDIRKMIRMRRLRDKHFAGELFSDPAWDMLLDLLAARIDRRPVSVSSLCIASAVPATTALRWIKTMTEAGLFERRSDPHDGRRVFIALSDAAARAMHAYFVDVQAVGSLLPV